jgi:predicted nucleic acid-binding protein
MHKAVLSAEFMLLKALQRARELSRAGLNVDANPSLGRLLRGDIHSVDDPDAFLRDFVNLDDNDVLAAVKAWTDHKDPVLSGICKRLVERRLNKVIVQSEAFSREIIDGYLERAQEYFGIDEADSNYLVFAESMSNLAYTPESEQIDILKKSGEVIEISKVAELLSFSSLADKVEKHFLSIPYELRD